MNQKLLARVLTLCVIFLCVILFFLFGLGKSNKGNSTAIVLCHGLGVTPEVLEPMKQKLKQAFPQTPIIVPHQQDTYQTSIERQSDEVIANLKQQNISKKTRLAFVGHSQGGLRAYWAAQKLAEEGYQIVGVATAGAPLEGVPGLDKIPETKQFAQDVKSKAPSSPLVQELTDALYMLKHSGPGELDMKPQSPFLKLLHNKLTSKDIPVLAIGGDASQLVLSALNDIVSDKLKVGTQLLTVSQTLDYLLGGSPHDTLIPLSSQLAKNIQAKNLERHTVQAIHGYIQGVPKESSELEHPKVMQKMIDFLGKKLSLIPAH